MTILFPGALDTFPRPLPGTKRNASGGLNLSAVIDGLSDATEALEAKLGIGASTPTQYSVLVGTAAGTSAWEQHNLTLVNYAGEAPSGIVSTWLEGPGGPGDPKDHVLMFAHNRYRHPGTGVLTRYDDTKPTATLDFEHYWNGAIEINADQVDGGSSTWRRGLGYQGYYDGSLAVLDIGGSGFATGAGRVRLMGGTGSDSNGILITKRTSSANTETIFGLVRQDGTHELSIRGGATPRMFYSLDGSSNAAAFGVYGVLNFAGDWSGSGEPVLYFQSLGATTNLIESWTTAGHTQPTYVVNASGKHSWGPGGSTVVDTTLYRDAANLLKTDDGLTVSLDLNVSQGINVGGNTGAGTGEVKATTLWALGSTGGVRMRFGGAATGVYEGSVGLSAARLHAATAQLLAVAGVEAQSSGTPAAGYGAAIAFAAHSANNTAREQGNLGFAWTTATDGSRTSAFVVQAVNATTTAEKLRLLGTGSLLLNTSTANTAQTVGITIQQAGADNEILTFKSSDVANGVTSQTETDTFAAFSKFSANNGGLLIAGFDDTAGVGLVTRGIVAAPDTARSTSALAAVMADAFKANGTGVTNLGTDGNIWAGRNNGATQAVLDAEGDWHLNATSNINAWDDHDDLALIEALRITTASPVNFRRLFADDIAEHQQVLHRTGVLTLNDDGHHFLSLKGAFGLTWDGMRQLEGKRRDFEGRMLAELDRLTAALAAAETKLAALTAA